MKGLKTLICMAASRENARKPLVTSPTRMPEASPTVQLPRRCRKRLNADMCGDFATSRSPMTTSAVPRTIGAIEFRDVGAGVLVVGVGVDDDVGAEAEGGVDAGDERGRRGRDAFELHDVRRAGFARGVGGVVGGAVIDDEGFDGGDAVDLLRNVAKRLARSSLLR